MKKLCALVMVVGVSSLAAASGQAAGMRGTATDGKQGYAAPSSLKAASAGHFGKTVQHYPQPGKGATYKGYSQAGYGYKDNGKPLPSTGYKDKGKLLAGTGDKYKTKLAAMPKTFGPNGSKFNGKALPYGKTFKATNGKSYTYQSCPQHLQHCCKSSSYCGWTHYCSFPRWNCCGCWCPVARCWYYWYEPYCCYLPCSCMDQYPPVQCGDPDTLTPPPDDGTNYGGTGTDDGSTTDPAPPLPQGASLLPRS